MISGLGSSKLSSIKSRFLTLKGKILGPGHKLFVEAHIHNDDLFELLMLPLIHQVTWPVPGASKVNLPAGV